MSVTGVGTTQGRGQLCPYEQRRVVPDALQGPWEPPPFSPKPCPEPSCAAQAAPTQQPGAALGGDRGGEERPLHRHRVHGQGETPTPGTCPPALPPFDAPQRPPQGPKASPWQNQLGHPSLGDISLGPPWCLGVALLAPREGHYPRVLPHAGGPGGWDAHPGGTIPLHPSRAA